MSGSRQSPISVSFNDVKTDDAMDLFFTARYNITRARLTWTDYAFMVTTQDNTFGSMNLDGVNYMADMVLFRSPSEHKIEGYKTPLEMQIFHRVKGSNPPQTLAVSVLFEESVNANPSLDWMLHIPKDKSPQQIVLNIAEFVSDMKPLIFYNGSYTQPPCSEGVTWGVSMGLAKVSHVQLKALNRFLRSDPTFANGRGNNRALQNLNGRELVLRSNCGMSGQVECGRQTGAAAKASAKAVATESGGVEDDGMFDDGDVKLW